MNKNINDLKLQILFVYVTIAISLFVVVFGAIMNLGVEMNNGGKMPVQITKGYSLESYEHHFAFYEKEEVNNYYFADIIKIFNTNYSVGDLVMRLGILMFLINLGL